MRAQRQTPFFKELMVETQTGKDIKKNDEPSALVTLPKREGNIRVK